MITRIFPFLLPLRTAQKKAFFYAGMLCDGSAYAKTIQGKLLPHKLFCADSALYNFHTGFDMIYQKNKVFNLQLAARKLNGLLIKPGETFSFWQALRHADKQMPYKNGLVVRNGELCLAAGGGLCQMSNMLFWLFLHSPLTVVERHTHRIKSFPTMRGKEPEGVDATVSEGWLDLKVKNETDVTFQIGIAFDEANITGSLLSDKALPYIYEIAGKDLAYFRENGAVYQRIAIYRRETELKRRQVGSERLLYINVCEITYPLSGHTPIMEEVAESHGQKDDRRIIRRLFA